MESKINHDEVMEVCLLAGKIMMQSGAETYRVEDTMRHIANAFGNKPSHSYVTPTGIVFSIDGAGTKVSGISARSTDLKKVTIVNSISRRISSGDLSVKEAYHALKQVEAVDIAYPIWMQIPAAALASGCSLIMFKGGWNDFIPACIVSGLGFSSLVFFHRLVEIKFFAEILASLIIGLLSFFFVTNGIGHQLDKIIIGSVMPMVPGLLITNAVRDLMAGHLVSGLSKGAEAFLTAFAIGAGVAVVLTLY
ncbi:threonine/serine exporter family protein [Scopulibacillus cellulosilyticus]|uniref:Threonine/serine exporter family protein n=1 Tax=Scopulibacillus cellulosilyticus TaxID=2665665 RepID=A0ABW2PZK7_9BACL